MLLAQAQLDLRLFTLTLGFSRLISWPSVVQTPTFRLTVHSQVAPATITLGKLSSIFQQVSTIPYL